jgi:hypothetical protein
LLGSLFIVIGWSGSDDYRCKVYVYMDHDDDDDDVVVDDDNDDECNEV